MNTTVIIICYDWIEFLYGSIESLNKQIAPIKKLVLTDGSTPAIAELVSKYSDYTLITQSMENKIQRVNETVKLIDTAYYLLLGVDDFIDQSYIAEAEQIFVEHPEIDVVHPDIWKIGDDTGRWNSAGLSDYVRQENTMFFSSVIKKSLFDKLNGYDETIPYCMNEDWDFWVRAHYLAKAKSYHLDKPYFQYRFHKRQFTQTVAAQHAGEIGSFLRAKWAAYE